MIPGQFEYHRPASLDEAVGLLGRFGENARVVAGGHSLIPMMKLRMALPDHLVDLQDIKELTVIREEGGQLAIGGTRMPGGKRHGKDPGENDGERAGGRRPCRTAHLAYSLSPRGIAPYRPHIGCDTSHCGACIIDLNGKSVKSCTVFAVQAALATECGYIAMVGSRKKARALKAGLRELGVADETVARLKAPAGLDIGAIEPEDIAVSIMGEIAQVRRQAIRQPADASRTVVAGRINVTS